MDSVAKRSEYRAAFDNLGHRTVEIDRRCMEFLRIVQESFSRNSTIGAGVCKLIIDEMDGASPSATLESPVGSGRIIRKWSINKSELLAKLVLERSASDRYDAAFWEPVWDISIPIYGPVTIGSDDEKVSLFDGGFPDDERFAAFAAALAMLRGLII